MYISTFFKKNIFLFFAVLGFLSLTIKLAYSQQQFLVDDKVTYSISSEGKTNVRHEVGLENLTSDFYAKSYSLTLENVNPKNAKAVYQSKNLPLEIEKRGVEVLLKLNFDDAVVGKNARRFFVITFEDDSLVTKTGEVWEVTIPKLLDPDAFRSYDVDLFIPDSFGKEAYISPQPKEKEKGQQGTRYHFDKDLAKSVISAGFGEFQVFSFTIKYHLDNPLNISSQTEIAVPPDTTFQKVHYEKVSPEPSRVMTDKNGNWLLVYDLSPRERLDITAQGYVQIFALPRRDLPQSMMSEPLDNLKESKFWQTSDPQIQKLAKNLKTPKAVYDYVVNTLSYDYLRVRPNVDRLGAVSALANPNSAICMEFTDLFIAISRAAGIPAREINGYAYTQNPQIEPLSLVADVLHSWPEYWDHEKKVWKQIDPTWENTTGGVDFFNQFDLRHFAFVIHGDDPQLPYPAGSYKLGSSPEKDVYVNFGELPRERLVKPMIEVKIDSILPFLPPKVLLRVNNPGPGAIYNTPVSTYLDGKLVSNKDINLLPFENYYENIKIPFSVFSLGMPQVITAFASNSSLEISTNKTGIIIYNLIAVGIFVIIFIIIILIRLKRLKLRHVFSLISFKKTSKNA